jgi:hypothetical protein
MKIYPDEPWVKYVFDTFLLYYPELKNEKETAISHGKKSIKNGIVILKGKKCKKVLDFNKVNIPVYHHNSSKDMKCKVIASYTNGSPAITFDKSNNIIYLAADILKTSFVMLSRIHEKDTEKDELNRFQANYSLNEDVTYPLVNLFFEIVYKLIIRLKDHENLTSEKTKSIWPDNVPYAVCLTHDVDNVYKEVENDKK